MHTAEISGLIKPFKPVTKGPAISHLFFVDDFLLFSNTSEMSITHLMKIVNELCDVSGHMVNLNKSSIHFNKNLIDSAHLNNISMVQMQRMHLHEKYLGINFFIGRNKKLVLMIQQLIWILCCNLCKGRS